MPEEFVKRVEFDLLKDEVNAIKKDMVENQKLLQEIDKKIDVISEKIISADKMDSLRLDPMEKRIKKMEDSQDWLWKTVAGTIIGIVIKIIFDVSKIL